MTKLIIIGTGIAGYTLAREFRRRDKQTELLLITRDDGSSYSKPLLSNALSKNKQADELVMANPEKMATDLNAEIWNNSHVVKIDAQAQTLEVERGSDKVLVHYEQLVLANGANTISAPIEGDAAKRVLSVNDLNDYRQFRAELEKGKRILIIGAGMIGCEFANDLLNVGAVISIVDLSLQPLGHLLPQQASLALQEKLTDQGVNWFLGNCVTHVEHGESALLVTLKDGTKISSDIVLSAIGLRPSLDLANAAGLEVERGIKVDRYMRTSIKNIYALGDCAQVEDLTLPFVMPLMASARALAATLAGEETAVRYPAMPVALKTPCLPVVVCLVPRRIDGEWDVDINEQGICGLFKDVSGTPIGFVLTGERVAEKTALVKQMPDWLA
jgi:rubredoxin-NAD+ reductase